MRVLFLFISLGCASQCLFQLLELILSVWQTQNGNAFNHTNIYINAGITTWTSLSARWIFCSWAVSHRSQNEQHSWYMELCLTKQQLLLRNEIPKPIPQAPKAGVCSPQQCTDVELRAPGAEAASSQPQTVATQEGIPEVYIYIYMYLHIYL